MKTCKACGHVCGNEFYTVTLTGSIYKYPKDVSLAHGIWVDEQMERVGFLCGSCWYSITARMRGSE